MRYRSPSRYLSVHRPGNAALWVILAVVGIAIIVAAVLLTREQEATNANINGNANTAGDAGANTNAARNVNTTLETNTNTTTNSATTNVNTNTSTPASNTNTTINTNTNAATNPSTTNANTSATAPKTAEVSMTSSGFSPRSVTIKVGDTVRWTNNSGSRAYPAPVFHPTHRAYAGIWDDDGTGQIANGQTYSFTFDTAGTYQYHDHLRPERTGTVIVE